MDETPSAPGVVLVMPTYQEAASIDGALDSVLACDLPDLAVLVVDDRSPDGTADRVRRRREFGTRVFLLTPPRRDGLGAAYRHGFRWALEQGADVVVQMDADGSHPVGRLPDMVAALREADLVLGSRYVPGGEVADWPLTRRLVSRSANEYARRVLGLRTRDCTSGFRAWRAETVRRVRVTDTTEDGYGFQVETTFAAERAGCRIVELPIRFVDRAVGSSKMSWAMALRAARGVARWRLVELLPARARLLAYAAAALAVLASVVARLPYLHRPLGSDEAGYLIIASQWSPGTSLYGNYWVDRPPGLLLVFSVVDALGGAVALKVVGMVCAATSVVVAVSLARSVAPRRPWAGAATALVVAALVSSPLLAVDVVDGELLALPFTMVGVLALLRAVPRPLLTSSRSWAVDRSRVAWAVLAGGSGCFAFSVKQSFAEVGVLTLAVAVLLLVRRSWRPAVAVLGAVAAGAAAVAVALLLYSVSRGTDPGALWDAVVGFRARASVVISTEATSATPARAHGLALSLLATGAPLALVLLPRLRWRWRSDDAADDGFPVLVSWSCLVLVGYELASVAAGGSYWLHYLVQVVPAIALVTAASFGATRDPDRILARRAAWSQRAVVGLVVTSSLVAGLGALGRGPGPSADQQEVADFLRAHVDRGDSAVVLFGNAGLLYESGMTSPYENLWSLPVKVRDPRLSRLTAVLDGPRAPHWVVVADAGLGTWGLDPSGAATAGRILDRRYRTSAEFGDYTVLELAPPGSSAV